MPVKLSASGRMYRRQPLLGEQADELLASMGRLPERGVVRWE